jgi:hypothetical protein
MSIFNVSFTNKNMDIFIKLIKPCINNKNKVNRFFLNKIYDLLLESKEYVDIVLFVREIKYKNKDIELKYNKKVTRLNTHFLPNEIKNYILNNNSLILEYSSTIIGRIIKINFHIYDDIIISNSNINSNNKSIFNDFLNTYDSYAKLILMWIYIINDFSDNKCSKELTIDIYHTPFLKELPIIEKNINGTIERNDNILDTINANSAFTTNCSKKSEITIFRKEEWFKVFLHETMHNFNLDFSIMDQNDFNNKIGNLFNINTKMNIFEGYCEYWARLILCCFNSFILIINENKINENKTINNENNKKIFYNYCDLFVEIERNFTIFQANKVLKYMELKYINLINDKKINLYYNNEYDSNILKNFKEKTNIFAYYIISCILLNDYNNFMDWSYTNNKLLISFNKTNKNLNSFFKFIKENYKTTNIIDDFVCIDNIYNYIVERNIKKSNKQSLKENKYTNLINTLRMSFIEII